MSLFVAVNNIQGTDTFDKSILTEYINLCKNLEKYNSLISEISFKSNGIYYYSEDLEESITKLKFTGILYTISPEVDALVNINDSINVQQLIGNRLPKLDEMVKLVSDYQKYNLEKEQGKEKVKK